MARKKPLTCPVCKKRFSHSAKQHPFGRLSKHMWKSHKPYMMKKQKSGSRKKSKVTKLDKEFMVIDDILLQDLIQRKGSSSSNQLQYNATHEQLGGLILEALIPIVTEGIKYAVERKKAKKK